MNDQAQQSVSAYSRRLPHERRRNRAEEPEKDIDISPLIDVVFILLIFFMVSTTFVKDAKLDLERPSAQSAVPASTESVRVSIDRNGTVFAGGGVCPPVDASEPSSRDASRGCPGHRCLVVSDRRGCRVTDRGGRSVSTRGGQERRCRDRLRSVMTLGGGLRECSASGFSACRGSLRSLVLGFVLGVMVKLNRPPPESEQSREGGRQLCGSRSAQAASSTSKRRHPDPASDRPRLRLHPCWRPA